MILGQVQQFASPEAALEHFGVKGMRWGVRNEEELKGPSRRVGSQKPVTPPSRTEEEKKAARKAMAKKAAIGAGVLTAVAGAGYVAYKLNQNGKLPLSSIKKTAQETPAAVKKVIQEQTDVIHLTRGKHKGQTFLKQGDTPNFFTHWEDAFVKGVGNADIPDVFQKLDTGKIAAAFLDPGNRFDFSGRPISHQVVIPKSMTPGLESIDDVKAKIWPLLKDSYDAFYKESEKPRGFG